MVEVAETLSAKVDSLKAAYPGVRREVSSYRQDKGAQYFMFFLNLRDIFFKWLFPTFAYIVGDGVYRCHLRGRAPAQSQ